jgi:hypothetical protein
MVTVPIYHVIGAFARWREGEILELTVRAEDGTEEVITTTPGHVFWVEAGEDLANRPLATSLADATARYSSPRGGRWIEAKWLRVGDAYWGTKGRSATVVGLIIRSERTLVYNLRVLRLHNYAVGRVGALAHNTCVIGETWTRVAEYAKKHGYRYFSVPPGTPFGMAKAMNRRWIQEAMRRGEKIVDIGIDRGRGSSVLT